VGRGGSRAVLERFKQTGQGMAARRAFLDKNVILAGLSGHRFSFLGVRERGLGRQRVG